MWPTGARSALPRSAWSTSAVFGIWVRLRSASASPVGIKEDSSGGSSRRSFLPCTRPSRRNAKKDEVVVSAGPDSLLSREESVTNRNAQVSIDHVLIAVTDLAESARRFETEYGLTALVGGRHPGVGTANMIIPLGSEYLELIAAVDAE